MAWQGEREKNRENPDGVTMEERDVLVINRRIFNNCSSPIFYYKCFHIFLQPSSLLMTTQQQQQQPAI